MSNKWKEWLTEQRKVSEMTVEEISLSEVDNPWGMQSDGNYRREPEGFFNIVGANIKAKREVPAWSQPMIKELGKGVVILIQTKRNFLITARQEPGNPVDKNYILLGATIQASESNLLQKHGGKKPPFAELLDQYTINFVELPQDGGRYFPSKINKYAVLEISENMAREITLTPNAKWFNFAEIREAFLRGETNEHLSQALLLEMM